MAASWYRRSVSWRLKEVRIISNTGINWLMAVAVTDEDRFGSKASTSFLLLDWQVAKLWNMKYQLAVLS